MHPLVSGFRIERVTSRGMRASVAILAVTTAAAVTIFIAGESTQPAASPGFDTSTGAHVAVTALPGVDLDPIQKLPGLEATSGPFPSVSTGLRYGRRAADVRLEGRTLRRSAVDRPSLTSGGWIGPRTIVLEERLARALRARAGSRVTVATAHGPAVLRVAGTALTGSGIHGGTGGIGGIGYVTPSTIASVAPNSQTHGSTLYLRLADPESAPRYAEWITQRYPGPQVTVAAGQRLETGTGLLRSPFPAGVLAVLLLAVGFALLRDRRSELGRAPVGTGVARRA
jgi:hypothetical protein